ncbi:MAG: universal stress protein [Haloplanus sp.]
MYDRILVPVDGSDPADAAAERGVELARRFDAAVELMSVVETNVPPMLDVEPPDVSGRDALDERTRDALAAAESRAADADVPAEVTVEGGTPAEVIAARANDSDVDLVTMGTHGRTGLRRFLLGSVTARVLRASEAPVLTTRDRDDADAPFGSILIPTDGSRCAEDATGHGLAIAEAYGATVHALSVVDVRALAGTYHGGSVSAELVDSLTRDREEAVEAVEGRATDRGLDAETTVVEGAPARTIREYVSDHDIDLVTMGTHGRSGVGRYALGSVAERLVRSSSAPVMTVPPADERR